MRNLLNPKWIFIINTLPLLVLFFIFYGEFKIIKSLLDEDSINLWRSFSWTLVGLGILNFGYGFYLTVKKQDVSAFYGIVALVSYITFIYLYGFHSDKIIPLSIPQWMIPGNMILYVGTFLMPTLAYSLFVLVVHFTPKTKDQEAWKSFLMAVLIPIIWYIFSQIILPLWKPVEDNFNIHVFLILIIVGTLIFLFFLVRGLFILATKKDIIWQKYQLAWKIPITIVLPVIGLFVNNGQLFNNFGITNSGIFGDFNHYWYYLLAVLNGLLICLPNFKNRLYRLLLFIGRSITFAYTFYFFIVFLPFLPLSIIAIVAIGTGFLMLTPLLLFVLHINELSKDFIYLKSHFSQTTIWAFSIAGFLVIPFFISANYLRDRSTLNQTLEYLYSPDYSKNFKIDKTSLQKTLNVVNSHKGKNKGGIFGTQQPYLSSYFNWLVLDNLTLSDTKINTIENIFFGKTSFVLRSDNIQNDNVEISNITTSSTYDKSQNSWKSWIELEMTNRSDNTGFSEYATTIEIPEGTWISDYYLYVGNKKEFGILAEKKTAMWVFSNIRNENRDPGILYYLTGNKVAFRVFPFAKDEIRKTGIELLHKEPIQFSIDGNSVKLGNSDIEQKSAFENENVIYVSAKEKQNLKKISRKPYFHFVVNSTNKDSISNYSNRIDEITKKYRNLTQNAKISFVNSYISTTNFDTNWSQKFQNQDFQGGFYVDRAIKTLLFNSYKEQTGTFPVIVVVTDSIKNAVFEKDFSDWSFCFPETNFLYNLKENGDLEPHLLTSNPKVAVTDSMVFSFEHSVLEYKLKDNSVRYLPDNNLASIILKNDVFEVPENGIKEKNWNSALTMQAKWISQILHPETTEKGWRSLVKCSFISKVMTPVTSYLVVENEAQKAILKKKQEQVLSSNKSLDVGEESQRMSEPSLFILTILLGIVLWYRKKNVNVQNRNE